MASAFEIASLHLLDFEGTIQASWIVIWVERLSRGAIPTKVNVYVHDACYDTVLNILRLLQRDSCTGSPAFELGT